MTMAKSEEQSAADCHAQEFAKRKGKSLEIIASGLERVGLRLGRPERRAGTFWAPILHQDGEDAGFGTIPLTPDEARLFPTFH
jgi:hypothetical protein